MHFVGKYKALFYRGIEQQTGLAVPGSFPCVLQGCFGSELPCRGTQPSCSLERLSSGSPSLSALSGCFKVKAVLQISARKAGCSWMVEKAGSLEHLQVLCSAQINGWDAWLFLPGRE